jgi:small-conductance mechanosensitive channel
METSYISDIVAQVAPWFSQHGARILSVVLAAVVINSLIRASLAKKRLIPSIIDNIPRPKYKNIITGAQQRRIETVVKALKDTLSFVVFVVAVLTVLPEFGVNVGPILAGLGLAGLALGMAAKDLITDFLAGFFMILEGEVNIGDKVKIGDNKGRVVAITLRRIILQGSDGSIYIIPNREIKAIRRFAGRIKEKNK